MSEYHICDLCSQPLKDNEFFTLYIADSHNASQIEDYNEYIKYIKSGTKEVCPRCKDIFDKMFELRLHRLGELADEINGIYNLKSKKNPKEKPDDKKKKR